MRTHRVDFLFHSLIMPRIDGSIFINAYSNRYRNEPSRTLDRRASDLMAYPIREATIRKWSSSSRRSRSFTRSKRNALRHVMREAQFSHSRHHSVRSKTRGSRLRTSRWIERGDRETSPQGCLKLELRPVSRKKAAPHWPLVVIVVDVVEIGRIRVTAVLVTGAT